MTGREQAVKRYVVRLSGEERERLEALLRKGIVPQRHERSSLRTKIVTYSCVEDDGGPLGIGFQEQIPNQSELLRSKTAVVSVGSKVPGETWSR